MESRKKPESQHNRFILISVVTLQSVQRTRSPICLRRSSAMTVSWQANARCCRGWLRKRTGKRDILWHERTQGRETPVLLLRGEEVAGGELSLGVEGLLDGAHLLDTLFSIEFFEQGLLDRIASDAVLGQG